MKRGLAFLLAMAFLSGIYAQEKPAFTISFNHLALSVKDVNISATFYKSVLMLPEITNRSAIVGIRWFTLADGRELHLISVVKENVVTNKAIHAGLTTNAFDTFLKKLMALQVPYFDWTGKPNTVNIRADGVKQIFFQDPAGYWLEVNSLGDASAGNKP